MDNIGKRLEESYGDLCRVLRSSQDFGLGRSVPPQLANVLEKSLSVLAEVIQERQQPDLETESPQEEDLAAELSQDADHDCLANAQMIG